MSDFVEDLRLALRAAARRPGFSAVVVATLGLAIGANAAVFSFVDAILLRPPAVKEPERLGRVFATTRGFPHAPGVYPPLPGHPRLQPRLPAPLAAPRLPLVVRRRAREPVGA